MRNRIRRFNAVAIFSVAGFVCAAGWTAPAQAQAPHPTPVVKPIPSPNAPKNENVPQGLEGKPISKEASKATVDPANEQEIRLEVQRLYAMATELKDEVDNTNSNAVLSVTVLKRAQEIEKLAKQIRDRAKK
jgi:hypothetical protein